MTPSVDTLHEVRQLRGALTELDGRVRTIAGAIPTTTAAAVVAAAGTGPTKMQSPTERRREVLTELEVTLETDPGTAADARASADSLRSQLVSSAAGATVVGVQCAAAFCKAVVEERLGDSPQLDTSLLIDRTPLLAQEAMFDYERTESVRRIVIYVARPGMRLPTASMGLAQ